MVTCWWSTHQSTDITDLMFQCHCVHLRIFVLTFISCSVEILTWNKTKHGLCHVVWHRNSHKKYNKTRSYSSRRTTVRSPKWTSSQDQCQREGIMLVGEGGGGEYWWGQSFQVNNFGQVRSGLMGSPKRTDRRDWEHYLPATSLLMLWYDGSVDFCVIIHHGTLSSVSICTPGPKMLRAISSRNGENYPLNSS